MALCGKPGLDSIALFRVESHTGHLTGTETVLQIAAPACVISCLRPLTNDGLGCRSCHQSCINQAHGIRWLIGKSLCHIVRRNCGKTSRFVFLC
jgi:hypothetical protein